MRTEMKEGFTEVRKDLGELKTQVAVLENNMSNMGASHASEVLERKELEKRVGELEGFRWKLMGMMTVGSAVISTIVAVALKMLLGV